MGLGLIMGILFVMKSWDSASELWMHRMMQAIADDISLIAAREPAERIWQGRVPVVGLPREDRSVLRGMAKRLRLPPWATPLGKAGAKLLRASSTTTIDKILVHYLDVAIKFDEVWRRISKPVFVHCHGYDFTWNQRSHTEPQRPRFGPGYREAACRLAERAVLIANSHWTASQLADAGIPAERIVVKYLGAPVPDEPPHREPRNGPVNILYLGRLVDFKGPDLVIRAFDRAGDLGLDARLVIAGDGPLRTTCELARARSSNRERIDIVGTVDADEGHRLRMQADIFTAHNCHGPLSQQEEGFGVSIIEAMAAGLPVVTGRTSSLCETVIDSQTGFLIEPGNIEAHAEALLKLGRDPRLRDEMGLAAYRRAKECFSSERERDQLRSILGLA